MALSYKEIFARKKEIAKEVILNYVSEEEVAKKYGCTPHLVRTFVRELRRTFPVPEHKPDVEPPIKRSMGIMGLIDSIDNYHDFIDTVKNMYIKRKLQQSGNISAAARKMDLERSGIYTIINKQTHA